MLFDLSSLVTCAALCYSLTSCNSLRLTDVKTCEMAPNANLRQPYQLDQDEVDAAIMVIVKSSYNPGIFFTENARGNTKQK